MFQLDLRHASAVSFLSMEKQFLAGSCSRVTGYNFLKLPAVLPLDLQKRGGFVAFPVLYKLLGYTCLKISFTCCCFSTLTRTQQTVRWRHESEANTLMVRVTVLLYMTLRVDGLVFWGRDSPSKIFFFDETLKGTSFFNPRRLMCKVWAVAEPLDLSAWQVTTERNGTKPYISRLCRPSNP